MTTSWLNFTATPDTRKSKLPSFIPLQLASVTLPIRVPR